MPVQQHVLNWLYSVLTSEYIDVNRTYNDVARALNRFPSLSPRTDVHTFPNGSSALLLHLSGTLPVVFRGSTYRFPVSIWVPHAYPREPPLIYVTPTESMMVRPGQHVDPQGQVYHPYLARWTDFWDKSTLEDFIAVLSDVFAKEPPVISRQAQRQALNTQPTPTPPPVPPLPPEMVPKQPHQPQDQPHQPPPPPPKQHADAATPPAAPRSTHVTSEATLTQVAVPSRYDSVPPLPTETNFASRPDLRFQTQVHREAEAQNLHQPSSHVPVEQQSHSIPIQPPLTQAMHGPPGYMQPQGQWQPQESWRPGWAATPTSRPDTRVQPAPPPPNILDEPLTLEVPAEATIAPPPIPPNPEKDALLRQLGQTLASMRLSSRQQNEASMAGLKAQRTAMQKASVALQGEMNQLMQLSQMLTSNTSILHEALHKADGVIENSRHHPEPNIDELLVAPTVVSNQLYALVAEERALGDAIFMLGRAVEKGRISPAVFAKMTRTLAREWYLKKALVRKIAQGMGLSR
ncbi:hypothetical protein CDD81_2451 [Ophiocordyceps australis]|uniref:UEV domain-containing protein n=1 Tax=Ophiocordyceps australis TaxID=1399860 RepID=A0A2C5XYR9_9HYPO|nr:hypothetical protein CDD81_2451 [Ophiocordyceps australis]